MKLTNEEVQQLIAQYQSELRQLNYRADSIKSIIDDLEKSGSATPKRRGRPPKAKTAASAAPKRRGRPPKAKTEAPAAPKRRGRPPKAKTETPAAPKRRGRPPKAKTEAPVAPKRRGRPPKAKTEAPVAPKRRGRPPKAKTAKKSTAKRSEGYRLSDWDNLVLDTLREKQKVAVFADFLEAAKAQQKGQRKKLSDQDLYRRINQSLHKLANKRSALIKLKHEGRGYAYGLSEWRRGKGVKKEYK